MSDKEFRAALRWMMVSDPWPLSEKEERTLKDMLNREAEARGFQNWVVAYHELPR